MCDEEKWRTMLEVIKKRWGVHRYIDIELKENGFDVGVRYGGEKVEILCENKEDIEPVQKFIDDFSKKYPDHPNVLTGFTVKLFVMPELIYC